MRLPRSFSASAVICTCLLVQVVHPQGAAGTDFYVRTSGSDEQDGLTPATAFATIRRAASALANVGDRVVVGPGTYAEGNITPHRNGIEGYPIRFEADQAGVLTGEAAGAVVIQPPEVGMAGFRLLGNHHVVIEGFTIEGSNDPGIQVRASVLGTNSAEVTIRDTEVRGSARSGIEVAAVGSVLIENNVVVGNATTGISVTGADSTESGRIVPRVIGNTLRGNGDHGVFVADARDGLVAGNRILSNGATGVTLRGTDSMVIANNLIYANAQDGIALGTGQSADVGAVNTSVANNTVYENCRWGLVVGSDLGASPGTTVVDNIFQANVAGGIAVATSSTPGYVAGFNINTDGYASGTPANAYDLVVDPLLVDPAGPDEVLGGDGFADDDFRLRDGPSERSPGIDAGSTTAEQRGMTGSALGSGGEDIGVVDIGYHYGASYGQDIEVRPPFMPLYVRSGGDDSRSGKTPATALASVAVAGAQARAGITVVVGPGRYVEYDVHLPDYGGRASFVADPSGEATGDPPGVVLVDAAGGDTGFILREAPFAIVDGFHVTGANAAGIQVRSGSDFARVRNNVVFSSLRRGVDVRDAGDAQLTNNLLYANRSGGIQLTGAPRTLVSSNTCYGNHGNGITVGAVVAAPCARVWYNITSANGDNGIQVGSNTIIAESLLGYDAAYNLNTDGYGAGTPRPESDLSLDPRFVDPAGVDGVMGGDGFEDDSFQLAQVAAGQAADSPAVDFAPVLVQGSDLTGLSTRSDGVPDTDRLDLGFHYGMASVADRWLNPDRPQSADERAFPDFCYPNESEAIAAYQWTVGDGVSGLGMNLVMGGLDLRSGDGTRNASLEGLQSDRRLIARDGGLPDFCPADGPDPCEVGDCDADGQVTVDELVTAVGIALGTIDPNACLLVDRNEDGQVTVDELLAAINVALGLAC
jgi:parallel beta-helix repeat protein